MSNLFWRQFWVLFWKNWIIVAQYPLLNLLRCVLLPVGYAVFLTTAQNFLIQPNNLGLGTAKEIHALSSTFDSAKFIWADATTNVSDYLSAETIISRMSRDFSPQQRNAMTRATTAEEIPIACPQNNNYISECFAALIFYDLPLAAEDPRPVNYTIRMDGALRHIDVINGKSSYEQRILPLQWAVDRAIIELRTGLDTPTPIEWPFTEWTNKEQATSFRLSYVRGLRRLITLAFFITFVGVSFQLPGAFASERANLLTSHLKAMGLLDSARILSWHIFHSLLYIPAWVGVAVIWHYFILSKTHLALLICIHVLLGLSLASHGLFIAIPFGKSPQLAAISATLIAVIAAAIAQTYATATTVPAILITLILPPSFYVFAMRVVCNFEAEEMATVVWGGDESSKLVLLPLLMIAGFNIVVWPYLAVLLEHQMYDAHDNSPSFVSRIFGRGPSILSSTPYLPSGIAISVRNLTKTYSPSLFRRSRGAVHAVQDLSFDIPQNGIFVLLGANGAGKSTTLAMIGGLLSRSAGSITFAHEHSSNGRPIRGRVGIVPQKNVMFPELTCFQNLRVWSATKGAQGHVRSRKELERVLRECDLGKQVHAKAGTLSGGQKRKLQLAIGLVGDSKIILVDECTSGVDPLSRRALWRILTSVKHERTVVFTTHFLDEADLLGDQIAVLVAPGKLVAHGTPVSLKSSLGEGYSIEVSFDKRDAPVAFDTFKVPSTELLQRLREVAPDCVMSTQSSGVFSYHLKSKDPRIVQSALELLEHESHIFSIASYDVRSSTMEDIFLGLMNVDDHAAQLSLDTKELARTEDARDGLLTSKTTSANPSSTSLNDLEVLQNTYEMSDRRKKTHTRGAISQATSTSPLVKTSLRLSNGRRASPFHHAFTIFRKRALITRRAWFTPLLAILVAVAGTTVPLVFIEGTREACARTYITTDSMPLYFPTSPYTRSLEDDSGSELWMSPPDVFSSLGPSMANIKSANAEDKKSFVSGIDLEHRKLKIGGISFDMDSRQAFLAWEATPPGFTAPILLNLASNVLYNSALNATDGISHTPKLITPNFHLFPTSKMDIFPALKWVCFFGAAIAVYPAFFAIYVSRERQSGVLAMQFSNGLSNPVGLWLGHLAFDSIVMVIASSIIVIVFHFATNQLQGLALFWLVLVFYGFAAILFAYCASLIAPSPLAAFAITAGYQAVAFLLYLASYLLVITYASQSNTSRYLIVSHFTISLISPIASAMRAAFLSVNLFGLLCDGPDTYSTTSFSSITRFGGPIAYLIPYTLVLFSILVRYDSGPLFFRRPRKTSPLAPSGSKPALSDVTDEAQRVASSEDSLRVLQVSKVYNRQKVVDNVSFGVPEGAVMALLGPNGAGKTTTFNMIRGDVTPTTGQILVNGTSVIAHPQATRLALGVCPQFTAIDAQLSVADHLRVYGRLKGLRSGSELEANVVALLQAIGLDRYRDRDASRLSGGNQRKLALAIALMGNPSVVLIDEFSSGVDAQMKREMWKTLKSVSAGKAVVVTTHSMEEASALANQVGILATSMLAVGTPSDLTARHGAYEVQFSCRTKDDSLRAHATMAHVPHACLADDVATRFEVPIRTGRSSADAGLTGSITLAQLFAVLSGTGLEFTVERPSLESVFLKVIREHNIAEEQEQAASSGGWWTSLNA